MRRPLASVTFTITQFPLIGVAIVVLLAAVSEASAQFTTESPQVLKMVETGTNFLEASAGGKTSYEYGESFRGGWGEHALAGYAHFKCKHDRNAKVVKQGIAAAKLIASGLGGKEPNDHYNKTVYNASIAAMLLADVDAQEFASELSKINSYYQRSRFRHGGYGYFGDEHGDVSQVQYAMLGQWTLDKAGIKIDYKGVAQTIGWLARVQDVDGGWPYHGHDPGGASRIKQTDKISASMAVAGGSGLLIAGDILDLWGVTFDPTETAFPGMPKSVRLFNGKELAEEVRKPEFPQEPLIAAIKDCQSYLAKNSPDPGKLPSAWPMYQLYTLERYESFRQVAFGLPDDPSPNWYSDGVRYLQSTLGASGGWDRGAVVTPAVSTSFAVLFLIRSTKRTIAATQSGTLAGGYELPSDTTEIVLDGTQIKGKAVSAAVDGLLDVLEQDPDEGLEGKSIPEDLELASDPKTRAAQIDRLERLLRGSQSWQARRVAAQLLGQSDEHRVVPVLIYALSDPDSMVKIYARDGLRFISRKFEGFGMPNQPSESQVREAQNRWRDWYRSTNPGYVFLGYDY